MESWRAGSKKEQARRRAVSKRSRFEEESRLGEEQARRGAGSNMNRIEEEPARRAGWKRSRLEAEQARIDNSQLPEGDKTGFSRK